MSVYNQLGTVIFTSESEEFTGVYVKEIDLTGNDVGVYFLQVIVNEVKFNMKLFLIN
jgi:hypothetical protein|tara:strand:- start:228 stop:398 length:171 start_codon:yes stop_codon:yes gene_type:complete